MAYRGGGRGSGCRASHRTHAGGPTNRATRFSGSTVQPGAADGKPNLNGVWQVMNTANWDIQDHPGTTGSLPSPPGRQLLYPSGKRRRRRQRHSVPTVGAREEEGEFRQAAGNGYRGSESWRSRGEMLPAWRAARHVYAVSLPDIQGTDKILIAYEFAHADRVIHLDKVDPRPYLAVDTWMGHSEGRWEGDTLVVDVRGLNDQTWFDRAGNFHSEALRVVERYTPIGPRHLDLRGHARGPQGLYAAVEDEHACVSPPGEGREDSRDPVRRVRGAVHVRHRQPPSAQVTVECGLSEPLSAVVRMNSSGQVRTVQGIVCCYTVADPVRCRSRWDPVVGYLAIRHNEVAVRMIRLPRTIAGVASIICASVLPEELVFGAGLNHEGIAVFAHREELAVIPPRRGRERAGLQGRRLLDQLGGRIVNGGGHVKG